MAQRRRLPRLRRGVPQGHRGTDPGRQGRRDGRLRPLHRRERAAWRRAAEYRTGSHATADGGALVPAILDAQIHLTNTGSVGRLRDAFRVENIVTDAYRGVTSAGVSASFGAENSAVADGSPDDMAVATVTARRGTAFVPASPMSSCRTWPAGSSR